MRLYCNTRLRSLIPTWGWNVWFRACLGFLGDDGNVSRKGRIWNQENVELMSFLLYSVNETKTGS